MRYDDLYPDVHGPLCYFLEHPSYGRYRDATVPRSWFKTSVATIAKALWLPVKRNPDKTILIAMNTADNAEKRVHIIKHHWQNNTLLQQAFPELVPDFKHTRWSNQCADIRRNKYTEEGTYESIGVGGAVVSRHYDHIIEDDLVYAKKDDLTGAEIQPNKEDVQKAIGWHKLVYSLFADPNSSTLDNIGTRWGVYDLKRWLRDNEKKKYRFFELCAEQRDPATGKCLGTDYPVWPTRFGTSALAEIKESQGPYMYATQYLNLPRDPADATFQPQWLKWYQYDYEVEELVDKATIVDLALWGDSKGLSRNVICTMGMDAKHNIWVLRYDRGKFNPTEVIALMRAHAAAYPDTKVKVEEVQYQRAIRHFAIKDMEDRGIWYNLTPLKYDGRKGAKDLRIRNIVNIAVNGGFHIKTTMKELYNEYCDHPSGVTMDILDAVGYGLRVLNPIKITEHVQKTQSPFRLGDILKEFEKNNSTTQYPFDVQCSNIITEAEDGRWFI